MTRDLIETIWLDDKAIHIKLKSGQEASEYFSNYATLKKASKKQLQNYNLSRYGIHWLELNEDLSFEGFFHQKKCDSRA